MAPGPAPLCPPYSATSNVFLKFSSATLARQTNTIPCRSSALAPSTRWLLLGTQVFESGPALRFTAACLEILGK